MMNLTEFSDYKGLKGRRLEEVIRPAMKKWDYEEEKVWIHDVV